MIYFSRANLKGILLTLAFLIEVPNTVRYISMLDGPEMFLGFAGRLLLLWGAIFAAAFIRPAAVRWLSALVLSCSAYFMVVFRHATTQFMTYEAFINLTNATGELGDAFAQNAAAFLGALVPALILLLSIGWGPGKRKALLPNWAAVAAPWLASLGLALIMFVRGGDGGDGLPSAFPPIAYMGLAGYEALSGEIGARQPVQIRRIRRPGSRNIVLVVDESIAGQYLDINSPGGVPTPLSHPWSGLDIYNYGLAVSVSNCSSSSNVTLRYGGTRGDYRRIIATQPSIWAYAHKAGLRTVYIDAQTSGGTLQNFMTEAERAEIDDFIQLRDLPLQQRDMAAARQLIRALDDPRPKFVLINKEGAHFPIQDRYPDAELRYLPALKRGVADPFNTGKQIGFTGSPSEWVTYRNSYRNTLLWNVGVFFDLLLRHGNFADTTLIYTSDHGQNLHEDGSSGLYTHCDPAPVSQEGAVPLVVIEGKGGSGRGGSGVDWRRDLAGNHDRSSHFMIFPTLLQLMGYDPVISKQRYGLPLDAPSIDPGTFNILFNARLKRQPVWVPLDRRRLIQPLSSDS
ncbi:sulfatase-like hydrolase/transferase [Novosphingobium sp. BL-8A]|uniref:sulfatase-like hydrolase/transferase n=1 Tax=Novosphingobium sp. BL-8A TaxID=3127639 RepID=UPI0037572529